jgi:hypothetical protein
VLVYPRLVLAVERYANSQSQLSLRDLHCARWTVRLAAASGAPRCDVDLVAARVSCGIHVRMGAELPCSIRDVSAITFGNLGELSVDAFELFVDNAPILKRELDLLLRFRTQSIVARCPSRIIFCDFFEALDLVLGGAAPVAVLVSFMMPWVIARSHSVVHWTQRLALPGMGSTRPVTAASGLTSDAKPCTIAAPHLWQTAYVCRFAARPSQS